MRYLWVQGKIAAQNKEYSHVFCAMILRAVLYLGVYTALLRAEVLSNLGFNGTDASAARSQTQQFSFPPNNTPVTKVYVFGRPVYIRQPFVLPQRDQIYKPGVSRCTWYSGPPNRAAHSCSARRKSSSQGRADFSGASVGNGHGESRGCFPEGWPNQTGFMCCNPKLERVMKDVFDELTADGKWQTCNIQKIANALQNRTQSTFDTDFEALAGLGDFASKTHFYSDLICKIEVQGRFMLSYATPNRHQRSSYVTEPESSSIAYI
ncbi:unnamed protein product [Heligmosomoides polygyrus]|uniref:Ground-like domain-containing protein n=1 Tax=Heligmosomoides polygyrus TaxID=6339 RepID=A0A183FZ57_HELPZ|nr:unnamed protein product [Heligmosomoides polygyrus]